MPALVASDIPRLKVCIIGAGLGGLTLAQLLMSSPGIQVTCYERSATLDDRLTGYRVMLSGSTLTTLKGKLWSEVWGHIALSIGEQPEGGQRFEFNKGTGETFFTWDSDGMRDQFSVSRWQLRQGLLHRSEPFLKVGKMFVRYEELPKGGCRVFFSDGSTDDCDLLVGADGWNSRVKRQLMPSATVKNTDMCVVYFKVPLTPKTLAAMNHSSGTSMAFCKNNQNILLGAWQNPLSPFATRYTALTIEPEESYIMFGISSPVSAFHNRRAAPDRLSAAELKTEIISRTSNDPNIHPRFATIAQMACTNTAYIHMVRKVEAIKPWATQNVTLLGDSVFNMSNMLGKGANCALLDAVSLAETLTSQTYSRRSPIRLQKYVTENIERRMRERHRSALMQKLVFYGDNKVKGFLRDKALPYTLKRIDGLDQENHSQMANGTFADWVADDEAWQDRSQVWAEELRWDEIYDEEHGHGGMVLKPPTPTSQCHACGSCGSVVSPSVASSVIGDRSLRRSGSIGAPSSIYSQASTMSPNYAADEATRVHPLGMNYYGASHAKPHMAQHPHMLPKVAAAMRGDVEPRALAESRASYATTMVDQQSLGYASRRTSMSQNSSAGSVGSACTTTNGVGNGHYIPPFCAQHGPGGCPTVQVVTSTCCPGHAIGAIPEKSEKRNAIHSEADLKCGGRVETVTVAPNEIL